MQIKIKAHKMVPHPSIEDTSTLKALELTVEVEGIVHFGGLNGYHFILKKSEVRRLNQLQKSGELSHFNETPHLCKKSYPQLRIPCMGIGDRVSLVSTASGFRCSPVSSHSSRIQNRSEHKKTGAKTPTTA